MGRSLSVGSTHLPAKLFRACSMSASAFHPNTRPLCSTSPTTATATMAYLASVWPPAKRSPRGRHLLTHLGAMAHYQWAAALNKSAGALLSFRPLLYAAGPLQLTRSKASTSRTRCRLGRPACWSGEREGS